MNLTNQQARALRRIEKGPATNLDVGLAIGLVEQIPTEAIGRKGARVARRLVELEAVAVFTKKGVPVYSVTGAGRKALAELDRASS